MNLAKRNIGPFGAAPGCGLIESIIVLLLLGFVASCSSFSSQRIYSSLDTPEYKNLKELEQALAYASFSADSKALQELAQEARSYLAQNSSDREFRFQVLSLYSDILFYQKDQKGLAQSYEALKSLKSQDERTILVQARLEKDTATKLEILETWQASHTQNPSPWIDLYRAQLLFDAGDYLASLSAWDAAFMGLPTPWPEVYKPSRDKAYALRNQSKTFSRQELQWLEAPSLDVDALLGLTLSRSKLLDSYGSENSLAQLKILLQKDGYLYTNPDTSLQNNMLVQAVSRGELAWFLARLVAQKEGNPRLLDRVLRYEKSPIPDVPLDSPFFRSILIVVQRELINLSDGVNFEPAKAVKPSDYLTILTKMEEMYP